eukprot:gene7506-8783_t
MNSFVIKSFQRSYSTASRTAKLLGQKVGKDGKLYTVAPRTWSESVSSHSEAIVKAERASECSIEEMQRQTIKSIHTSGRKSKTATF